MQSSDETPYAAIVNSGGCCSDIFRRRKPKIQAFIDQREREDINAFR